MFPSLRRWIARRTATPRPSRTRRLGRPEALERRLMMDGAWTEAFQWDVDWRLAGISSVPALESLAGAPHTLYLDFDGNFEPTWATDGFTFSNVQTAAFDTDGDPASFSPDELSTIERIWKMVAEDYAPFNVNVTTVDPGGWENADGRLQRVVVGGFQQDMQVAADSNRTQTDWDNNGNSGYGNFGQYLDAAEPNVCYVFSAEIWRRANDGRRDGNGKLLIDVYADLLANTASHEAGHAYGLAHQVELDDAANVVEEYAPGTADWTPIMGDNYSSDRLTWWNGAIKSVAAPGGLRTPVFQDELAILSGVLGYRADDHSDTISFATGLGELPFVSSLTASGVIAAMGDVDYFSFSTGGGLVSIDLRLPDGANLDGKLQLWGEGWGWWSEFEMLAEAEPADALNAGLEIRLDAGTYFVAVAGHGRYGDLGQYTLRVTSDLSYFDEVDDSGWTDYGPIDPDPWYSGPDFDEYDTGWFDPYVYDYAPLVDAYDAYDYFVDEYAYLDQIYAYDTFSDGSYAENYDSYAYDSYVAESFVDATQAAVLAQEEAIASPLVEAVVAPNYAAAVQDAVFGSGPTDWLADAAVASWESFSFYSSPSSLYLASYSFWM